MMATTKIESSAVNAAVSGIKSELSNQSSILNDIVRQIQFMQSVWDSPAQSAFAEKFDLSKTDIEKFNKSVSDFTAQILSVSNSFTTADNDFRRKIQSANFE